MFRVVIVSWNVQAELQKCLVSLGYEKNGSVDFEVVVVDNGSSDQSADLVKEDFPWVKLMALDKNMGFAKACNLGVEKSLADYILFLNPDAEVASGFFSDLERSFIQHPDAGIIGGHIYNEDGSTQLSVRAFPGLWVGLLEALKLLSRFSWLAPGYILPRFNYAQSQEVDQVMGACFAVRSKVWQELEGFDESFFVWFEEVDFCKRAKSSGHSVWYESRVNLVHSSGKSFRQLSYTERHKLFMRSLVHYLYKHYGFFSAGLVWFISRPVFVVTYLYHYAVSKNVH